MQELHTLSLYLNPFTEDPEYRLYVLHHLQSVQFLDTKEVQQVERRRALKLFNAERQKVLDTIAFGRRALPPPIGRKQTNALTKPVGQHVSRKSTELVSTFLEYIFLMFNLQQRVDFVCFL
nr:leucine-rich repeat-containing protein 72 [Danio rerio]XP_021322144.1 leucine-rich repeat-containing protein 72 [Danio rerio]|eukprot:XP_021322143.1 leucine-rich repeat-containing protein 72 [Danio rerio]